ncbi:hypothetical protein CCM_03280 [Cordyceps militaris CM01]|uniref:N-acetyltransferase domain-containing protein n=1 Tax=Cordyceps militaris (strain CM01) TaxID=983644 RepID=G3J9T5_CORMM|nr:uncharacterized protein CCM_03280 [Cordyceps militaris CM01]EGX95008.1 hypothetical protein CCM_03280 [Cordyceps militaris CM01]
MSGPPPSPALGVLRVATPADILRIGIVAAASFCYSPLFRWERPHHEEFPDDTLLSYRTQFKDAMSNDEVVVLVVEDAFIPNENDCTKAIIPPGNGWTPPAEGEKVVVGVASIKLEPGSNRRGQFASKDGKKHTPNLSQYPLVLTTTLGEYPELPPYLGRDLNRKHYDAWGDIVGASKKNYCYGFSFMNMVAVHPAYWRRGHGTKLGVSAAEMGANLYKGLGYTFICKVEADGDEDDPEDVVTVTAGIDTPGTLKSAMVSVIIYWLHRVDLMTVLVSAACIDWEYHDG